MKYMLSFLLPALVSLSVQAQTFGEIQAFVKDSGGAPLPGVVMRVDGGTAPRGDQSDLDGRLRMGSVPPGRYEVSFRMMGKATVIYRGVEVLPDRITRLNNVVMADSAYTTGGVIVEEYTIPLIREDGGTVVIITAKELKNMPSANGGDLKKIVSSLTSDIKVSPSGDELYFRGSRSGAVVYFIDGVKIRENVPNIPSSGIGSIAVYSGGVPAKYGDSTGGYVIIETKSYLEDYYEKRNSQSR